MIPVPFPRWRLVFGWWLLSLPAFAADPGPAEGKKHTFVIVHGAWGGGWDWKTVGNLLTAEGHTVYRPTLTGLGERVHLAGPDVGLSVHVTDIVNVILYEDLRDVVLVGHSYAGLVITGAMDRVPERIEQAIYLDAFVPEDGQSGNDCWREMGRAPLRDPGEDRSQDTGEPVTWVGVTDGMIFPVGVDMNRPPPIEAPQSLKTWTEPVSFGNPLARKLPGTAVWFVEEAEPEIEPGSALDFLVRRVEARGWKNRFFVSDHLAERTHPVELAAFLERLAQETGTRPNTASGGNL